MATSSNTRRKTPPTTDQGPLLPDTTPRATAAKAAAKRTTKQAAPATAPTTAPVAAPAPAPNPTATQRPSRPPRAAKSTEATAATPAPLAIDAPAPQPTRKKAPAKKAVAPTAALAPSPVASTPPQRRSRPSRSTVDDSAAPVTAVPPTPAAAAASVPVAPEAQATPVADAPVAPAKPAKPAQPAKLGKAAKPERPTQGVAARQSAPAPAKSTGQRRPAQNPGRPARGARATEAAAMPSPAVATADDTARAVLAMLAAPAAVAAEPPQPTGPAHSAIVLVEGDQRQLAWRPGHACPAVLRQAAQRHVDAAGHLLPEDDAALPLLLRLATAADHPLQVDEAVWAHLAAHRDARHRLGALEAAYPEGPASAALQQLLRAPLPLFQAEGALFAVVAGRALIADERGLGKGVMAIAAARLWRRHFGVQRVLVLCAPSQRSAWQRAWQRFAGPTGPASDEAAQVIDGGLHQRQAMWSTNAGVRILSPDALDSDAAHLTRWAPELIIVDEPQQLALRDEAWSLLDSPHALVLCGAPLAEQPALMDTLVDWLDPQRLGPLAALRELYAASQSGRVLGDADIERLTTGLSRLMLQRLRADVAAQLPALVHTERLVPLTPGQRELHDEHAAQARRLLAGWQRSGYCSDADQWRLSVALRSMLQACHRADPADAGSALAEATVQVLAAQLDEWATTGALDVAVLCASPADRAQLAQRLAEWLAPAGGNADGNGTDDEAPDDGGLRVTLVGPDDDLPSGLDAVVQVGVPWRPRRHPAGARGETAPGQQWVYLVAQDSIECGLFDTLAQRIDVPRGLIDAGARDYLQGDGLNAWLGALQAALDRAAA